MVPGMVRDLRINLVEVGDEKEKRIIHYSTFSSEPEEKRWGAASERDEILGSDPSGPPGGRDAPDSTEDLGG